MWGHKVIPRQWGEKPGSNKASRLIRRRLKTGGSPGAGDLSCNPALLSLTSWICLNPLPGSSGVVGSDQLMCMCLKVTGFEIRVTGCWGRREVCPLSCGAKETAGWQPWFGGGGHHNSSGPFAVTTAASWEMLLVTGLVYISDIYKTHPLQNESAALTFM